MYEPVLGASEDNSQQFMCSFLYPNPSQRNTMKRSLFAMVTLAAVMAAGVCSADPVGGPKSFEDGLTPGVQARYELILRKEEATLFNVRGDGRSDIDCFLYDGNGNLLSKDDDATDTCALSVTPRWTGRFTLLVRNVGDRSTYFVGQAL